MSDLLSVDPPGTAPGASAEDPRVTAALEEYLNALEAGRAPDPESFRTRYPEIADSLLGLLDGLEFLHRTAASMQVQAGRAVRGSDRTPPGGRVPVLADYQILREVGRGGMGIVYEAVQRSLNRRVALKVLSLAATLDPRHRQRFQHEAQAAARLHHQNIVPIFAVGCEQGVHYYAMQFIRGKPLSALIRESRGDAGTERDAATSGSRPAGGDPTGPSPTPAPGPAGAEPTARDPEFFREVARIGVQAAEALQHAHQMGIIHRDVKPANLLLETEPGMAGLAGRLWITDFGLARGSAEDALTRTGDMLGTLRYMSPEQAAARRGLVDHRTDVYSLGATLYELLTLQPVFGGEDRQELLHQVLHEDPVPPRRLRDDIPRDLETILLKALARRVEDRYATAQDLADDLRRFRDGRPLLARRPSLWDGLGKWARRHRAVAASCAAFLILAVLGLAAGAVVIGHERARTQAAYEQEAQARRTEAQARAREAEARARAEYNFRQARELLDYIAETAAVDMTAEADLPRLRRRVLLASLAYYEDFVEQHNDNQLTHEELLRGYTRVATLLEAAGRPEDARAAWNEAARIAATSPDDQITVHLAADRNRARLIELPAVQKELKLTPAQVCAFRKTAAPRPAPGEGDKPAVAEVLSGEQRRRLDQLLLQQAGVWAFLDPDVATAIKLTPAQRAAIAARNEVGADARPSSGEKAPDDRSVDRILWVFTAEQRARWRELTGEPFRGSLPPPSLTFAPGNLTFRFTINAGSRDQKW